MFTTTKTALLDALKLVGQVVEKRNTIPILQNVLFQRRDDGRLVARVTDLDIEAMLPFTADVDIDFRPFTVPAHLLHDIVRKLPEGGDVKIEAADAELRAVTIRAGRSRFTLPALPENDFPTLEAGALPFVFEVPAATLGAAISATAFAISTEATRYYLNGIHIHACEQGVKLVTTDGHRLARRLIPLDTPPLDMPGIIVPSKTVAAIEKHLPKDGAVKLALSDAKIRVEVGDMVLISKLIDGTFPDYQRVVPQHDRFVEFEGRQLSAAIDRVSTISSERGRAVRMSFRDHVLSLSVNSPDTGTAEDDVPFEGEAELETAFNAKYVTEALARLAEGTVLFHFGDTHSPALLRADGDHTDNCIILMPMRI